MTLPSGVTRILKAQSDSAFAVLGLPVGEVSSAEIEAAKRTQLARIDAHPERHTPVADDARLAVHVAAAQLVDPALRERAIRDAKAPSAPPASPVGVAHTGAARTGDVPASWAAFAKQAGPVLAHAGGGINRRSLPLLGLLAQRHGVAIGDVPLALRAARPVPMTPVDSTLPVIASDDDNAQEASPLRDGLTIAFVVVAFGLSVFMVTQGFRTVYRGVGNQQTPPSAEAAVMLPEAESSAATSIPDRPENPVTALEMAGSMAASNPVVAVEWLEAAWPPVSEAWLDYGVDERRSIAGDVVSIVRGAWSRSSLLDRVFRALEATASDESGLGGVLSTAEVSMAIGLVPDVPRAVNPSIDRLVGKLPGHAAGDEASPLSALRAMLGPLSLVPDPLEYERWLGAISEYVPADGMEQERVRAIDWLVTRRDHPSTVLERVLRVLMPGLSVTPGSPLAQWLPRAFRDVQVSNAELHDITRIVASLDPVDAIDARLVLSVDASPEERTRVREAIEGLLDPASRVRDRKIVRAWAGLTRATLRRMDTEPQPATPEALLERTVLLSRLSEAARWLDDEAFAGAIIRDLPGPLDQLATTAANVDATPRLAFTGGSRLDFVTRYERVRRTPQQLLALLTEAQEFGSDIAAPVAEIIAEEALLGTDRDSREAAFVTLFHLANAPVVLNAVLETLPRAGRNSHTSRVIEQVTGVALPAPTDPDWARAARAAVVTRLLEEFSVRGESRRIGSLAALLDASYAVRAAEANPARAATGAGGTADEYAGQMLAEAMRSAGALPSPEGFGVSIDDIRRRARGREAIAQGSVETFAARQASLLAVRAYLLSVEDPSVARSAREVFDRVSDARRGATTLGQQIVAVERGFVELWMLRFGEPTPGNPEEQR